MANACILWMVCLVRVCVVVRLLGRHGGRDVRHVQDQARKLSPNCAPEAWVSSIARTSTNARNSPGCVKTAVAKTPWEATPASVTKATITMTLKSNA